jgi:hypothetical protein
MAKKFEDLKADVLTCKGINITPKPGEEGCCYKLIEEETLTLEDLVSMIGNVNPFQSFTGRFRAYLLGESYEEALARSLGRKVDTQIKEAHKMYKALQAEYTSSCTALKKKQKELTSCHEWQDQISSKVDEDPGQFNSLGFYRQTENLQGEVEHYTKLMLSIEHKKSCLHDYLLKAEYLKRAVNCLQNSQKINRICSSKNICSQKIQEPVSIPVRGEVHLF